MKSLAMYTLRYRLCWAILLTLLAIAGCQASGGAVAHNGAPASAAAAVASVTPALPGDGLPAVVNPTPDGSFEHSADDFTQGLLFSEGALYESTGRIGESKLRRLNASSGQVEGTRELPGQHFGEGLASFQGRLYQLTWTSNVCLVYDQKTLEPQRELFYNSEGWGLTVSPQEGLLVFSDGSPELRFLDPESLVSKRKVTVTDGRGRPVANLNELEWVRGEIWANIWMTDRIARIEPKSGKVLGWVLFTDLMALHHEGTEDVLNGMAYDPDGDRLWITGKLWPKIYRMDGIERRFFAGKP